MNIIDIIKNSVRPKLYEKGNSVMWTDEYISKQILDIHLNKEVDLGSRKEESIIKTVDWILDSVDNPNMEVLDLGCGPGLYSKKLASRGHNVTGIDFSASSINFARADAEKNGVKINYVKEDYLNMEFEESSFDLVILIYTDLGVLLPEQRNTLISKIYRCLKPGGVFIFDVLNDKNINIKTAPPNWEAVQGGFWSEGPYLALSNSFLYEKEKVILYQHNVIVEDNKLKTYRFWTHFFNHTDLNNILRNNKFFSFSFYENVLPESDLWNGDNVTFCKAQKDG